MARKDSKPPTDRLPPHSDEAEQGVLGCILLKPTECIMRCISQLPGPEVFFSHQHRTIYELLLVMHDGREPIDMITVIQRLTDAGQVEAVGGRPYLSSLPDSVPNAGHLDRYIQIVFEKFKRRRYIQGCTEIIQQAYDESEPADGEESPEQAIERMQRDLLRMAHTTNAKSDWSVKGAVQEAIRDIEADIKSNGAPTGLPTGFPALDRQTRGFKRKSFVVIAARPSMGKSTLAMNFAEHWALDNNIPVGVFSIEMDKPSLMRRLISARSRTDLFRIDNDLLAQQELSKFTKVGGEIARAPLYIDDTAGIDDVYLRSGIRQMWHEHGIQAVVIDYFQLLHARGRFDTRTLELGHISKTLKNLGKELNIVVVMVAQLSREADALMARGERPRISHLKDCGGLEQDADIIGLLYPTRKMDDDGYDSKNVPSAIDIAKQRNGPTGPISLVFRADIFRFVPQSKIQDKDVPRETPSDPRFKD